MGRLLALPAMVTTFVFGALILFMPAFAPETAVLATYEMTPNRDHAIYLLDVRSGNSYFTGLLIRPGNNSMWSADGLSITTVRFNPFPATFDTLDLTTGERQSYPMQAPNGPTEWQGHPTKLAYSSALNRGSLIVYDRETGEAQTFLEEHRIYWIGWLPESDTLIVNAAPQTIGAVANLYMIDTVSNEVQLLREAVNPYIIEIIDNPLRIIYNDDTQIMSFSPDTPDNLRTIFTLSEDESLGIQRFPSGEFQLFVANAAREMWEVDLDSGERVLVREVSSEGDAYFGSWSPDGERSVWMQSSDNVSTTFRIERDGEEQKEITVAARLVRGLWSPDGRYFLTLSPSGMFNIDVYLVDTVRFTAQRMEQVYSPLFWQPSP